VPPPAPPRRRENLTWDRNQLATRLLDVDVPADPACAQAGLRHRADLRVGRGKDGDHLAQLVRIVADGMTGPV
jgi:hypothetical protein